MENIERAQALRALRSLFPVAAAVFLAAAACSCTSIARHEVAADAPEAPSTPWNPPKRASKPLEMQEEHPALPKEFLESKQNWTLADIVDLALRNNPDTRATWASARAAAANLGSKQGAYFPQVELDANYSKTQSSFSSQFAFSRTSYEASLALNYLLFDFGKRGADVEEARQALYRANWTHNATIQNVVLQVQRVYYQYLYAKAVREADRAAVEEAEKNLDAANQRHDSGLATIADVLQARSTFSQKKLALQTVEGQVETIRGSLATAMGLSPTIDYDVGFLPDTMPAQEVSRSVEELIQEAQKYRPDLAASRAAVQSARAHLKSVRAEGLPAISLEGNVSRRFYNNPNDFSDNYLYGAFLTFPLFTGFSHHYDIVKAESEAKVAEEQYATMKNEVELDVWTSYYDLKTATERLTTAREFLESATESHSVALERYKAGVGTILELLSAQTTLEDARAQDLQARTDWLLTLSQLAYATGRLEASGPAVDPESQPSPTGGK